MCSLHSLANVLDRFDAGVAGELRIEIGKNKVADIVEESQADYKLCDDDIPQLTELLIEASHKWEEIGVTLRLRRYQIEDCRSRSSNQLRLYEVITQWMGSEKHPTIGKLSSALASKIVAMNNIASQMEKHFLNIDYNPCIPQAIQK